MKSRYKNSSGGPFELTDSQAQIFEIIARRMKPRVHCMTYTQFGKSDVTSMAVLTRATTFPEKWAIVAPSNKKAHIIMGYLIGHIFDNEVCQSMFEVDKGESVDRIRRERSKNRITFKFPNGAISEVFTLSSEGRRTKDLLDALLGFGAPNIVIDESSLLDDPQYAGVFRMLGGSVDNFLFEIGNPMRRNHFHRSSLDPNYLHINMDYKIGVSEGRIQQSFIEEMRTKQFFEQLYDNKFPDEDMADYGGYSPLIGDQLLNSRIKDKVTLFGKLRLGCDVAGEGSNLSVITLRGRNGAKILYKQNNPDTMNFAGVIVRTAKEYGVIAEDLFIDGTGIGKGVVDRVREDPDYSQAVCVMAGSKPQGIDFFNKRAEMFWRVKEWLPTAELEGNDWLDLLDIRYKIQSDKKIKIKSKEDMRSDGVQSPDTADSLSLTFWDYDSEKLEQESQPLTPHRIGENITRPPSRFVQPDYESPSIYE